MRFAVRESSLVAGISLLIGGGTAMAGPLSPPAGPVAATPGPEPRIAINAANTPGDAACHFKITQPGSYYLAGNLTGVADKHGIGIAVSGVTIDLNGFELVGVPNSDNGIQGLIEGIENITIRNGHVRDWGGSGVYIGGGPYGSSIGNRIDGVIASRNAQTGITSGYFGTAGCITNCTAHNNGTTGIATGSGSIIQACTSYSNGSSGIVGGFDGIIKDCFAYSNDDSGIYISDGTVVDCVSRSNGGDGIYVGGSSIVRGNVCARNGSGAGNDAANIKIVGADNRIENNNCVAADRGIEATAGGNIFLRNTCSGNGSNWEVIAGNRLVVVSAPAAGAVTGNTGGTALGSTDPNANFTY